MLLSLWSKDGQEEMKLHSWEKELKRNERGNWRQNKIERETSGHRSRVLAGTPVHNGHCSR